MKKSDTPPGGETPTIRTIDFDHVLKDPKGNPFKEPRYDEAGEKIVGTDDLTLGSICYMLMSRPLETDKLNRVESVRMAKLAALVIGGQQALMVDHIKMLLERLDKFPISPLVKASIVKILDPVAWDAA